jgi:hypothetical protein
LTPKLLQTLQSFSLLLTLFVFKVRSSGPSTRLLSVDHPQAVSFSQVYFFPFIFPFQDLPIPIF